MAANTRLHSQIQHAIQYPSGHLDRFASFGPTFEMSAPGDDQPIAQPATITDIPSESANSQFDPKRFITAGKATFTLQGINSRYTYRITRSDPDLQDRTVLFISLLTGSDNTADYTYLGLLDEPSGQVRLTRKSRYTVDSVPVRALGWACRRLWQGRSIEPARLFHVGSCGRCGRALTVPASIESGFGPECSARMAEG